MKNPIRALQDAQSAYGYLSKETLQNIAKNLGLPLSQVYGVATFYHQFRFHGFSQMDNVHMHRLEKAVSLANQGLLRGNLCPGYDWALEGHIPHTASSCFPHNL